MVPEVIPLTSDEVVVGFVSRDDIGCMLCLEPIDCLVNCTPFLSLLLITYILLLLVERPYCFCFKGFLVVVAIIVFELVLEAAAPPPPSFLMKELTCYEISAISLAVKFCVLFIMGAYA